MAEKSLHVEIVTPAEKIYSGNAMSVTVPGALSPFEILFNHAPIVSSLDIGQVKITDVSNKNIKFAVSTGFAEVKDNKVSILVEEAVNADSISREVVVAEIDSLKSNLRETTDKGIATEIKKLISIAENKLRTVK